MILLLIVLVESLGSNTLLHVLIDFQKKGNVKDITKYMDLNDHLKAETEFIESNCILPMQNNTIQSV